RDQRDRHHYFRDAAGELVDLIVQLFNVDEAEVVFLIAVQSVLDAHRDACILDGRLKTVARAALAVNLESVASEELQVGGDGNVDVPIERVAEERPALFFDAHHAHRQAADFQGLSDCIDVRKELVLDVAAEHDHECRTLYFIS